MHDAGLGLFEEIASLRAMLRAAFCNHNTPLSDSCYAECSNNDARAMLGTQPGAASIAHVKAHQSLLSEKQSEID